MRCLRGLDIVFVLGVTESRSGDSANMKVHGGLPFELYIKYNHIINPKIITVFTPF